MKESVIHIIEVKNEKKQSFWLVETHLNTTGKVSPNAVKNSNAAGTAATAAPTRVIAAPPVTTMSPIKPAAAPPKVKDTAMPVAIAVAKPIKSTVMSQKIRATKLLHLLSLFDVYNLFIDYWSTKSRSHNNDLYFNKFN